MIARDARRIAQEANQKEEGRLQKILVTVLDGIFKSIRKVSENGETEWFYKTTNGHLARLITVELNKLDYTVTVTGVHEGLHIRW